MLREKVQIFTDSAGAPYELILTGDSSISNPTDAPTWQKMAAIKSNILRRMDNEPAGVRLCCVKFIQSVVQVQTPGQIADPRVRDLNQVRNGKFTY